MIRPFSACVLLCVFFIVPAEAKPHLQAHCVETGTVMVSVCMGQSVNFLAGVRSISVTMKRDRAPNEIISFGMSPDASHSIAQPARYIAGPLVCAVNLNTALAEIGIRGTGSPLAHSSDRWGVPSRPVPGAVAVTEGEAAVTLHWSVGWKAAESLFGIRRPAAEAGAKLNTPTATPVIAYWRGDALI